MKIKLSDGSMYPSDFGYTGSGFLYSHLTCIGLAAVKVLILILLMCLTGCITESSPKFESGKIVDQTYIPGGSAYGYTFGKGGGPTHTHISARYSVVIQSENHKWILSGSDAKKIFEEFALGDHVQVCYVDLMRGTEHAGRRFVSCRKESK